MTYQIEFTRSAVKEMQKLERCLQRRIIKKIEALAEEPQPAGSKKLSGSENVYRIKIGDYRVVYELIDGELVILLLRIRHRREFYR